MRFHHRTVVNAPLDEVRGFHMQVRNMVILSPPPLFVHVLNAPEVVSEGAEMEFAAWLGFFSVRWHTRFQDVTEHGFDDVLIRGPFRRWRHQHTFVAIDADNTEVIDTLDIELTTYPFWRTVGRVITWSLPVLFAWRSWRARRLLGKKRRRVVGASA